VSGSFILPGMDPAGLDQVVVSTMPAVVNSELLCFVADRSQIMTADDLVKVCSDFYTDDEIVSARDLINSLTCKSDGQRLPKRKTQDKARATVEDVVKVILNPNVQLPQFYAVNLTRLPPVTPNHCDMSLLLGEIQSLRSEVRAVSHLRDEIYTLKEEVKVLSHLKKEVHDLQGQVQHLRDEIYTLKEEVKVLSHLKKDVHDLQGQVQHLSTQQCNTASSSTVAASTSQVPPEVTGKTSQQAAVSDTFAALTKLAASDPAAFLNYQKRKQPSKLVVGRSATNKRLQSVVTTRKVDLFVSRLNPNTAAGELIDYAKSATTDVVIHDVACTRLQSKFEDLYASFYVAITVDSVDLKRAVELFMAADSWPAGVFVKRYFKPKDGSS